MPDINPIKISGRWREGFALDYHTISSTYVCDDEYGRPIWDTKYTDVGGLLLRLKYRNDTSVVKELVDAAAAFVRSWKIEVDLIAPVPPSRRRRTRQPVLLLAGALGERLGVPACLHCISRSKEIPELKNVQDYQTRLRLLQGAHRVEQAVVMGKKVLLLDDLYRSGATMNEITKTLYDDGRAAAVYAFTITRTRSKA